MYKLRSLVFVSLIALLFLIDVSVSQVVCSQDELIKELYEDLIDNGIPKSFTLRKTGLFKKVRNTE